MELKNLAPIFALLIAVGIIFGGLNALRTHTLGFDWFTEMAWYVVGTVTLLLFAVWLLAAGLQVELKLSKE